MPNESNNRAGRVFIEADYNALEMRTVAEALRDPDYRTAQDGGLLPFEATTRILLQAPPSGARGDLRFSVVKNRTPPTPQDNVTFHLGDFTDSYAASPSEGVRCRLCNWTYVTAECPCRLPAAERIRRANEESEARLRREAMTRFNREDVI